jgi:hypothetical protein
MRGVVEGIGASSFHSRRWPGRGLAPVRTAEKRRLRRCAHVSVGGMGDLLTGVIASMRAQGLPAVDAACAGALMHAHAGDEAARDGGERGLLPSDLLPRLRRLANPGGVR